MRDPSVKMLVPYFVSISLRVGLIGPNLQRLSRVATDAGDMVPRQGLKYRVCTWWLPVLMKNRVRPKDGKKWISFIKVNKEHKITPLE